MSATGYKSKTSSAVTVGETIQLKDFAEDVTITATTANVGSELTVNYSVSEIVTISYQWKQGTVNVGINANTFIPSEEGIYTVTISATGFNNKTSDAIRITEGNIASDGSEGNPFPLTEGEWKDGEIIAGTSSVWYSFKVTSGTVYNLYCNGYMYAAGGDGNKTADIVFEALYSDGSSIFNSSYISFTTPESFTASKSDIVKLKGTPWSIGGTGTFSIGYCIADTNVTLSSVTANGSSSVTTTQLTLSFDKAILLSVRDITIVMGGGTYPLGGNNTISVSGITYTVDISNLYVEGSQSTRTMSVAVQKTGYAITGSPKTTTAHYVVPSVPTGVNATALSSNSIRVSWNAVSGAASYRVAIANASQASVGLWNFDEKTDATSITFYGLNTSQTYYFRVIAYNGNLSGLESSTVSATTQSGGSGSVAPSIPTGVSASAT